MSHGHSPVVVMHETNPPEEIKHHELLSMRCMNPVLPVSFPAELPEPELRVAADPTSMQSPPPATVTAQGPHPPRTPHLNHTPKTSWSSQHSKFMAHVHRQQLQGGGDPVKRHAVDPLSRSLPLLDRVFMTRCDRIMDQIKVMQQHQGEMHREAMDREERCVGQLKLDVEQRISSSIETACREMMQRMENRLLETTQHWENMIHPKIIDSFEHLFEKLDRQQHQINQLTGSLSAVADHVKSISTVPCKRCQSLDLKQTVPTVSSNIVHNSSHVAVPAAEHAGMPRMTTMTETVPVAPIPRKRKRSGKKKMTAPTVASAPPLPPPFPPQVPPQPPIPPTDNPIQAVKDEEFIKVVDDDGADLTKQTSLIPRQETMISSTIDLAELDDVIMDTQLDLSALTTVSPETKIQETTTSMESTTSAPVEKPSNAGNRRVLLDLTQVDIQGWLKETEEPADLFQTNPPSAINKQHAVHFVYSNDEDSLEEWDNERLLQRALEKHQQHLPS